MLLPVAPQSEYEWTIWTLHPGFNKGFLTHNQSQHHGLSLKVSRTLIVFYSYPSESFLNCGIRRGPRLTNFVTFQHKQSVMHTLLCFIWPGVWRWESKYDLNFSVYKQLQQCIKRETVSKCPDCLLLSPILIKNELMRMMCELCGLTTLNTYLNLQFVTNGQSWVLQCLDDRSIGVWELGVLPDQSYRAVF